MRQWLLVLCLLFLTSCSSRLHWVIYYGSTPPSTPLKKVDWAILEPDNLQPSSLKNPKIKTLGYISLGEINSSRSYWPKIQNSSFIVEENPNWPGAYRVDIRSTDWQDLLIQQILPSILNQGFDGFFLDTVDTALYLQEKDPVKYSHSQEAMVNFIKKIRASFPKALIVPNNGLEMLPEIGKNIDAILVEDLYTRYDFNNKTVIATPTEVSLTKEKMLDKFTHDFHKPVLALLYENSTNTPLTKHAISKCKEKDYSWAVTTVDLMHWNVPTH